MAEESLRKLNFKKSLEVLKEFCENENEKRKTTMEMRKKKRTYDSDSDNDELIEKTNQTLATLENQKEFIELIENLEDYNRALEKKRSETDLNLHDSLKVLINLYNKVPKKKSSSGIDNVGRALEHQRDIVKRVQTFALNMGAEAACGERPRQPIEPPYGT